MCFLFVFLPLQSLAASPTSEYKLKAALIYKLSKFVEWPDVIAVDQAQSFGVCLLGEDSFGSALDALEEKTILGVPVKVHRFSQSASITGECRVLFISKSKQGFLQKIINKLQGQPILTLSDTEGFADQGGIIQFTYLDKKIGFKINLDRAKGSELKIAAPLLELATIVKSSN